MKKKLLIVLAAVLVMGCLLAACGAEPSPYEGKWIGVAMGDDSFVSLGEDAVGMVIELKSGGKGTLTTTDDNDTGNIKWTAEDGVFTISDSSSSMTGTITDTCITIEESGFNLYFGKEGTEGMNTENYLPEKEKAMIGTWTSVGVTDILENDISDVVDPAGMTLTFVGDRTMTGSCDGTDLGPWNWTNLDDWGSPDEDDVDYISWTIDGDTLTVDYHPGDDWFIYTMKKG